MNDKFLDQLNKKYPGHKWDVQLIIDPNDFSPRRLIKVDGEKLVFHEKLKISWTPELIQDLRNRFGEKIEDELFDAICERIDIHFATKQILNEGSKKAGFEVDI